MTEWGIALAVGATALIIRLLPETVLRGRAPPPLVRDALPWLPVAVAGTFVGALHFDAVPRLRLEYLLAAGVGGLTLLWRRTFYLPLVAGAATLALVRLT